MYLKSITLYGFKSFADKTTIEFSREMTAIVGPNGSGKSNINDAVKWVLGEQSAKTLRGGNMQDVIFAGSEHRKPLNVAEVSLTFDNADKTLPIEYNEVSVTRRLYRSGDSEYLINGQKCRMKDIQELIMDSGIGKDSFSIISQGKVDELLSSKPEERRQIFEEAAGVLKYKQRKKEAINKLTRTQDNLNRVEDIVAELEQQIKPLENQAKKAGEYMGYKDQLEEIEISLIVEIIDKTRDEIKQVKDEQLALKADQQQYYNEVSIKESSVDGVNTAINKLDADINNNQEKLIELTAVIERSEGKKELHRQQMLNSIENKERYEQRLQDLNARKQELNRRISVDQSSLSSSSSQIKTQEKDISELEREVLDYKKNAEELENKIVKINNEINTLNERYRVLNNLSESHDNLFVGVKNILSAAKKPQVSGIEGVVSDLINTSKEYNTAIQTALGASLQNVVTMNNRTAQNAIEYLKTNKFGRATFLPIDTIKEKSVPMDVKNQIEKMDGYIDIAENLIIVEPQYQTMTKHLLGNVIITENLPAGLEISKKINRRFKIITLDGEVISPGGALTGGIKNKSNDGLLTQKNDLKEIPAKIETLKTELNQKIDEKVKIIKSIDKLTQQIETSKLKLAKFTGGISNREDSLTIFTDEYENIDTEINNLEQELKLISNYNTSESEQDLINQIKLSKVEKEKITALIRENRAERLSKIETLDLINREIKEANRLSGQLLAQINNLEIKIQRKDVELDKFLDRLREEYELSYEAAKMHGKLMLPYDEAKDKVSQLRRKISGLGIINIGAIDEFERLSERYNFLTSQKDELSAAKNSLLDVIEEMDGEMSSRFDEMFKLINITFNKTFKQIFGGGHAEIILTDPNNMLESGVDIIAQPPGKKHSRVTLLSGGEKALTAITLLISILKVKDVPVSILDEIEAALDEANVLNVAKNLKSFSDKTQFIMVTHRKGTMEVADNLYGVTMQESGVSKIVSVKMNNVDNYLDEEQKSNNRGE